jgi:hypothetical protein
MICEYGCGGEATYYFKIVKKWCCSPHFSQCPSYRKKYSNENNPMYKKTPWNKGKNGIYKEETLEKMRCSKSSKGKTYEEIYGEEKAKELKQKRSESFSNINKGREPWNKNKKNVYSKETLKKIKNSKTYTIDDYIKKYPTFIEEELPKFENGKIQVQCKLCGLWFTPSKNQLYERLRRFDREYDISGNSYFYCSDECKYKCEYFHRQVDPEQLEKFKRYNTLVYIETYKTLKKYYDKIENLNLRGNEHNYELDHKYSIYKGFINNIPPIKIAHYKNLQVIPKEENRSKGINCSITLSELLSFK